MGDSRKPQISLRKQPRQSRSSELVAVILAAAAQVLAKEGAARFTTARVAEKAGVSIGSLYQYFPNKAAILFRLQHEEWRSTTRMLADLLDDAGQPAEARLRRLVQVFLQSECEEAAMRVALHDAAPLYRDAPEAREARAAADAAFDRFVAEVWPQADAAARQLACDLLGDVLGAVGKQFSERPRTAPEIERYARAMADMLWAYLRQPADAGAAAEA